ncbi:hypothetical protein OGAPHI_005227 [Ogataea philodendri]|uniref:Uncharacterized protein n=1 Tax=Ogataea philodendri TaxID=1378263 RepID=A0A9P8P343_9ASCO|nr:uncharacterized protein OGAPHI_005227 [Ogataea philodendri]KAH3663824.1 hypothetical protein OGAPHI_005227 [Ogataea philodendri]
MPLSSHLYWKLGFEKNSYDDFGSNKARFSIRMPFQPSSKFATTEPSCSFHSSWTNCGFLMNDDIGVIGSMWIPWMYSLFIPK